MRVAQQRFGLLAIAATALAIFSLHASIVSKFLPRLSTNRPAKLSKLETQHKPSSSMKSCSSRCPIPSKPAPTWARRSPRKVATTKRAAISPGNLARSQNETVLLNLALAFYKRAISARRAASSIRCTSFIPPISKPSTCWPTATCGWGSFRSDRACRTSLQSAPGRSAVEYILAPH